MPDYTAVSLDGFGEMVLKFCADHVEETKDEARKRVTKAGKVAAQTLREVSPRRTGKYASGWKSKTVDEGLDTLTATVYNTTKPSLSHLLEFGHGLVYMGHPTGKRVPPYPHMDKGYDAGSKELLG